MLANAQDSASLSENKKTENKSVVQSTSSVKQIETTQIREDLILQNNNNQVSPKNTSDKDTVSVKKMPFVNRRPVQRENLILTN